MPAQRNLRTIDRRGFLKLGGASLAGAALLGVSGCGGGETIGSGTGTGGKVFTLGRGADSVTLDPIHSTDSESSKVCLQMFDTLVNFKPSTVELVPALATEVPETENGGLVYTFMLREGVEFHDGTPLDAEGVVFNFDRWKDTGSPYHKGGGAQGADFSRYGVEFGGFDDDSNIESVEAVDERTVRFTLKRPQGAFLNDIAIYTFGIASPEAIKKDVGGFWKKPVGTGPFKFASWEQGSEIRLEANKKWWGGDLPEAQGGGSPNVDTLIFKSIEDNTSRVAALSGGELSAADGLTPDDIPTVEQDENLVVEFQPPLNIGYVAMNLRKEPFDDPRVRRAVALATNMPEIVKAFFGETAEIASNPMPPIVPFFNESVEPYPYDPDEASRLLEEANLGDGFDTTLWYMPIPRPYMPDAKGVAQAMQQDLEKVGIKAELMTREWGTYIEETDSGAHDMCILGWSGSNADPDTFLNILLNSAYATKENALNVSYYENPQLDDLLNSALRSPDESERRTLYLEAQEIIHDDVPMLPVAYARPPLGFQATVENYEPSPTGDRFNAIALGK
ncbi:MAG: ABC transporter substrate-binding protein [Rubrobacter sp.]